MTKKSGMTKNGGKKGEQKKLHKSVAKVAIKSRGKKCTQKYSAQSNFFNLTTFSTLFGMRHLPNLFMAFSLKLPDPKGNRNPLLISECLIAGDHLFFQPIENLLP